MTTPREAEHELDAAVRERRARRELGRAGERSLVQTIAIVGSLGWTIVIPGLIGIAIGRWLDRVLETGITFSSALLVAGLAGGCALAWRRVHS